ncbi:MAG: cohesin domain-containing protein [Dehalococcoidia bacterium]|jgi:hypothetical protein
MKVNVKIAIIAFLIVIAINITVVIVQFAGKSPTSTSTLQPGETAIATPTYQPGSTASLYATPTATYHPTATSAPGQTPAPTSSSPTPGPTQTATPTATPPGATPTPEPTSTPAGGGGGGGGGTLPTPTTTPIATPTSTQTPTTVVSISTASQVQRGSTLTIDIDITPVTYLALAGFDLSFDADILELEGLVAVNWGSQFNPTKVFYQTMEEGLIRVVWDNADWANNENNGYGASGSGTLCRITFTAVATGTSHLSFVEGCGSPVGEHTLIRWMAWIDSVIPNVGWTNGSVTVVN